MTSIWLNSSDVIFLLKSGLKMDGEGPGAAMIKLSNDLVFLCPASCNSILRNSNYIPG